MGDEASCQRTTVLIRLEEDAFSVLCVSEWSSDWSCLQNLQGDAHQADGGLCQTKGEQIKTPENILTTFCAYDKCLFIEHMHFWHVDPLISAKTIIFLFIKPTSPLFPAARWVEWLHARADEDDGRHHDFRPAGGRVRSRRGLPQLLPRLPDGRGHPPSTPGQR